jgi:hypothetical protein
VPEAGGVDERIRALGTGQKTAKVIAERGAHAGGHAGGLNFGGDRA